FTSLANCSELAWCFSSTLLIRRCSCQGVNIRVNSCRQPERLCYGCSSIFVKFLYHFCYSILTDK
ncbi:unnamed protein product, partial [Staurois parvus]